MLAGIALRNPEFTEEQCRKELMRVLLRESSSEVLLDSISIFSTIDMGFESKAILRLVSILESLEISYLIGGSFASAVHGMCRTTQDADFLVDIKEEEAQKVINAVDEYFHVLSKVMVPELGQSAKFKLIDLNTAFEIDVYLPLVEREFDRRQFLNKRDVIILPPDQRAFFASAEDIVLAKLEWYKVSNEVSDVQWNDIVGVVKVQSDSLDVEYMRNFAAELNVSSLLECALKAGSCAELDSPR